MVTVAELSAKLDVRDGGANKRLKGFGLTLSDVAAGLSLAVGAAKLAANAIKSFTTDIAKQGDEIAKTAGNLQISAETLQEFEFAAKISGAGINEFRTAVQRMQKGLNDARIRGTGPFADGLRQIGLGVDDFDDLSPDEIFTKLSDSLGGLEDATTKVALAQDFFGRGGKTLLPLIDEQAEGINALRQEFRDLGGGFSNDGAASAEEFQDSMLRLTTSIDSIRIAIGEDLLPVVDGIITEIGAWANENREAITQELTSFLGELIESFRSLRPTIEVLLPIVKDMALFFVDAAAETGQLFREVKQLDERLTESLGPAWGAVKLAMKLVLSPLGAVAGAIGSIIRKLDKLITRLAKGSGAVGSFARTAQGALAAVGLAPEPGRVKRGAGAGPAVTGGTQGPRLQERVEQSTTANLEATLARETTDPMVRTLVEKELGDRKKNSQRAAVEGGKRAKKFFDDQQAITALRNSVRGNRRLNAELDKLSQKVALGQITADQAASTLEQKRNSRSGGRGKRRSGGGSAKPAVDEKSFTDLFLAENIQQRVAEGAVTPTILVTVTNNNITQNNDVSIPITGLSSTTAREVQDRIRKGVSEFFDDAVRGAVQDLEPVARR